MRKRIDHLAGPAGAAQAASIGIRTTDATEFSLRREWLPLDGVLLERWAGTAREHGPSEGPAKARGAFDMLLVEHGSVVRNGEPPLTAADVLLAPRTATGRYHVPTGTSTLVVSVDRGMLLQVAPRLPDGPVRLDAGEPFIAAVRAFAGTLLDGERPLSAVEGYASGQLLAEMVGAVLLNLSGVGQGEIDPAGALRDRALAAIAQRHVDPAFGPVDVAREAAVSLRRLQEAFAEVGTTVASEIRRQRMQFAVELLSSPRFDVLNVDEIAARAGFGSTLSLRRALSELRGCTPSQVRNDRTVDGHSGSS